jgi:folate-dependent phosphoribosylglycinamide formyltransferase PurN
MPKLVMLASPGDSTNIIYNALSPEIVILESPQSRFRIARRRASRLGWMNALGQILFRTIMVPWLHLTSSKRINEVLNHASLSRSPIPSAKLIQVSSVNQLSTLRLLNEIKPDVVIVNGTRIISRQILESVDAPFINTHAGITPLYRGVHGGYWALVNGDLDHCGVTVHIVDPGIDTGEILFQYPIHPSRQDSFVTYPYLQLAAAIEGLRQAVIDAPSGKLTTKPAPSGESRVWVHPTLYQYLKSRIVYGVK